MILSPVASENPLRYYVGRDDTATLEVNFHAELDIEKTLSSIPRTSLGLRY